MAAPAVWAKQTPSVRADQTNERTAVTGDSTKPSKKFLFSTLALEAPLWVMVAHWASFINLRDRLFLTLPTEDRLR